MNNLYFISGININLRLISVDDAAYVQSLRTNPHYNTYLSRAAVDVNEQHLWIEKYKSRERNGDEFYFIIERKDGVRCGTVRIYDIEGSTFTWGSWILDESKPPKASLESAVLSFNFAFNLLNMDFSKIDVRIGNTHAERFYRRFGMVETHRNSEDIFFSYTRERFEACRSDFDAALRGIMHD